MAKPFRLSGDKLLPHDDYATQRRIERLALREFNAMRRKPRFDELRLQIAYIMRRDQRVSLASAYLKAYGALILKEMTPTTRRRARA